MFVRLPRGAGIHASGTDALGEFDGAVECDDLRPPPERLEIPSRDVRELRPDPQDLGVGNSMLHRLGFVSRSGEFGDVRRLFSEDAFVPRAPLIV